jgi:predicted acylesterase/phospholipase RssA
VREAESKKINLALQGGGAHGAFGWGVIDRLIEDERLVIEGISATSAGSVNAVVYAWGHMNRGRNGARDSLEEFWRKVSVAGRAASPFPNTLWSGTPFECAPGYVMFDALTRALSPYQFNPFDLNPLRDVLSLSVDFEALETCRSVELFLSATNVRSGQIRVFRNHELTIDCVLASACLKDEYQGRMKHVLLHAVRADEAMCGLSVASKFNTDWAFLCKLRDLGREAATLWLAQNFEHLGERSSVDVNRDYLDAEVFGPMPQNN